jgi:ABC-2 type transport system ATP-binding protein
LTPFIELGVGFNPELTGRENVFLNGALLGFSRKEMQKLYNQIVDFAEIKRFMDQKLKNYSSGMQVRLAFSIAVQVQSDILLIDEVLAVGDAAFQRKCYDYFMSLKKKNQTVVLVTHDMSAIRQYCDRAIMIEAANVVSEGRPEKIAQAYQQLFSNNSSDTDYQVNDGEDRWGTGEMLAEKPVVEVNDKDVIIHTQYVARTKLPAPIYGISIYNGAGDLIADGNTRKLKLTTQGVSNKGKVSIVWRLPNIFASGKHTVSVACCDQSATLFYDWLNGTEFTIDKKENTTALVDPIIKIDSYET